MNGVWVIGVDPSSRKLAGVAMSVFDPDEYDLWLVKLKERDPIELRCLAAFRTARAFTRRIRRLYDPVEIVVFIEGPLVGRGGVKTTVIQSKVHGATIAGFVSGGAAFARESNASTVKKAVVGTGKAEKHEIMQWVADTYPDLHTEIDGDQDLADAMMHCRYGIDTMEKAGKL